MNSKANAMNSAKKRSRNGPVARPERASQNVIWRPVGEWGGIPIRYFEGDVSGTPTRGLQQIFTFPRHRYSRHAGCNTSGEDVFGLNPTSNENRSEQI